MINIRLLAALVILATMTTTGHAYWVKALVECADVVREDSNPEYRQMNLWWLMGYITARNYDADTEVGRDVDDEELYATALRFCKQNSGSDWDDAAIYTYDQYR